MPGKQSMRTKRQSLTKSKGPGSANLSIDRLNILILISACFCCFCCFSCAEFESNSNVSETSTEKPLQVETKRVLGSPGRSITGKTVRVTTLTASHWTVFRIATWTLNVLCFCCCELFSILQYCKPVLWMHMRQLQTKLKYCSDMCTDAWLFIFVWCRWAFGHIWTIRRFYRE